jgi:hypothetical protein
MTPQRPFHRFEVQLFSNGSPILTAKTNARSRDMARCLAWNALRNYCDEQKKLMPAGITFRTRKLTDSPQIIAINSEFGYLMT